MKEMDGWEGNHLEVRGKGEGGGKLAERYKRERPRGNLGESLDIIPPKKGDVY